MKIAFGELKPLLQAQRIFVGGQTLACATPFTVTTCRLRYRKT
jgi:hypothetical protein